MIRSGRVRSLLGCLLLTALGYWILHVHMSGTIAGDRPAAALEALGPKDRLLTMLGVVPQWLRLLLLPVHLQADYSPQETPIATGIGPPQLLGAAVLCLATVGAVALRRRRPAVTLGIGWCAISLVPVSNVIAPSGILLAERTLFLPSVGAAIAVGSAVDWLITSSPAGARRRAAVALVGSVIVVLGVVRSATRQPAWRDNEAFLAHLLQDAPLSYRTHWIAAHTLATRGDRSGVEREFRRAVELYPDDPKLLVELANRYGAMNRCADAVPLYRRAQALRPGARMDARRLGQCLETSGAGRNSP